MVNPIPAVVPQLGGLVVSEQLEITGTGGGAAVAQQTEAIVNHLTSLPVDA